MKAINCKLSDFFDNRKDYSVFNVLFEQEEIDLHNIYHKNGKYYSCCGTYKEYALVEEIQINNDETETCESIVTCPFCGHGNNDSWELSGSDDEYTCGTCGAELEFERIVTVEYVTKLVKKPNIIEV